MTSTNKSRWTADNIADYFEVSEDNVLPIWRGPLSDADKEAGLSSSTGFYRLLDHAMLVTGVFRSNKVTDLLKRHSLNRHEVGSEIVVVARTYLSVEDLQSFNREGLTVLELPKDLQIWNDNHNEGIPVFCMITGCGRMADLFADILYPSMCGGPRNFTPLDIVNPNTLQVVIRSHIDGEYSHEDIAFGRVKIEPVEDRDYETFA